MRKILSRLFRVFVHVYIHHFDRIAQMGSEAHVNTCYKHFYYFVTEFSLIDPKELEPLVSWGRGTILLLGGIQATTTLLDFVLGQQPRESLAVGHTSEETEYHGSS